MLNKSFGRFSWRRNRHDVLFNVCCVPTSKIAINAALVSLQVPQRPWHNAWFILGLFLNWFILGKPRMSTGFDGLNVIADHLTRMAHFFPLREEEAIEENALFLHGV
jgi:hypothetical protein